MVWIPNQAELQRTEEYAERLEQLNKNFKANLGQRRLLIPLFSHVPGNTKKRVFGRAGRKGGKSYAACYTAARIAGCFRNAICYIIGPSIKQTKEIYWETGKLKSVIPPEWNAQYKETELRIKLPWNSFIKLDGSESYSAYEGTEYDLMIIDEYCEHDPRFYDSAYPNLLARDGILVVIGTPPKDDDPDHHYLQLLQEAESDADWATVHWTSYDNEFLPGGKEWLDKERKKYFARGEKPEFLRWYMAQIISGTKRNVFQMFSRTKHCRKYEWLMKHMQKDFKRTEFYAFTDPGAASAHVTVFIGINPYTSTIYVLGEVYEEEQMETSTRRIYPRIQEEIVRIAPHHEWFEGYDSAEAWYPGEVLDSWPEAILTPSDKAMRPITDDISLLKDAMLEGRFYVAKDYCPKTIKEIQKFMIDKNGKFVGKDHALDDVRYTLRAAGYTIAPKPRETRRVTSIVPKVVQESRNESLDDPEDYLQDDFTDMEDDEWII